VASWSSLYSTKLVFGLWGLPFADEGSVSSELAYIKFCLSIGLVAFTTQNAVSGYRWAWTFCVENTVCKVVRVQIYKYFNSLTDSSALISGHLHFPLTLRQMVFTHTSFPFYRVLQRLYLRRRPETSLFWFCMRTFNKSRYCQIHLF
jgi:hypothetical protein